MNILQTTPFVSPIHVLTHDHGLMKWISHGPPTFLCQLGFLSRQKVYQFDLSPLQAGGKVQPLHPHLPKGDGGDAPGAVPQQITAELFVEHLHAGQVILLPSRVLLRCGACRRFRA